MARKYFNGWIVTGWAALAIGVMIAAILITKGVSESGVHLVIRSTAQTSFVLFTCAFIASPLLKLWPTEATRL